MSKAIDCIVQYLNERKAINPRALLKEAGLFSTYNYNRLKDHLNNKETDRKFPPSKVHLLAQELYKYGFREWLAEQGYIDTTDLFGKQEVTVLRVD